MEFALEYLFSRYQFANTEDEGNRGTLREEQKSCGTARFCSEATHKYTDVRSGHRV